MGGGFFTHSRGELLRPDTRLGAEAGNGLDQLKSTRFALQGPTWMELKKRWETAWHNRWDVQLLNWRLPSCVH